MNIKDIKIAQTENIELFNKLARIGSYMLDISTYIKFNMVKYEAKYDILNSHSCEYTNINVLIYIVGKNTIDFSAQFRNPLTNTYNTIDFSFKLENDEIDTLINTIKKFDRHYVEEIVNKHIDNINEYVRKIFNCKSIVNN